MKLRTKILIGITFFIGGIAIVMFSIAPIRAQITQIMGLAVAQTPLRWNNTKDAAAGDNQTNGILVSSPYLYDGANFDAWRGDTTNGAYVQIMSLPGITCGTAFYAIKRTNITNGASVNIPFGFTSKKVIVETDPSNTAEIVVDWLGAAAVIPGANAAGDDRIAAGRIVTFDDYAQTSISVIADSAANQIVFIRAYR